MCGLVSQPEPGFVLSQWSYLDFAGPDPWTGFLAWSWTCPVTMLLPYGLDSWLDLATLSGLFLFGSLGAVGQAMGSPWLLAWLAIPQRKDLLLLLSSSMYVSMQRWASMAIATKMTEGGDSCLKSLFCLMKKELCLIGSSSPGDREAATEGSSKEQKSLATLL